MSHELDVYEVDALDVFDGELAVLEPDIIDVEYNIVKPAPAPVTRDDTELALWADSEPTEIVTTATEIAPKRRVNTALDTYSSEPLEPRTDVLEGMFTWLSPAKTHVVPVDSVSPVHRWRYVAEVDSDEPEHIQHLRYFYLLQQYGTLVTEWSEDDFWAWVESLSDADLALFCELGSDIAEGRLCEHLDEDMQAGFDAMQHSDAAPVGFWGRLRRWL